ncbi:MAG: 4Fe-4S dicluster domain-containing protein, partial [Longimicrobiales bacterium]|nr:4Fe-4S dicluster domain-containing protein [Longimicrobiales bacterium]
AAMAAIAGNGVLVSEAAGLVLAEGDEAASGTQAAILYDSTLCVGCRACELACNDQNQLGRTSDEIFAGCSSQDQRALGPDVLSCVTQHEDGADPSKVAFGKAQCMHCLDPACASVCPVRAMEKTSAGPVVWHSELCLGCRYCMMACPFEVPRFEWGSPNPRIRKCTMCHERIREGGRPACVEICPSGALAFGSREELLVEARRRVAERPREYVHHVYGEREAGGTTVLHLAAKPFGELGYKTDLPEVSPVAGTRPAMAAIPFVLNGLALFVGAAAWLTRRKGRLAPLSPEEEEK